jgi:hypothetical protein
MTKPARGRGDHDGTGPEWADHDGIRQAFVMIGLQVGQEPRIGQAAGPTVPHLSV